MINPKLKDSATDTCTPWHRPFGARTGVRPVQVLHGQTRIFELMVQTTTLADKLIADSV